MRRAPTLSLPAADLEALHLRVGRLAENRPAVYRMVDPTGRVIYVGKAKSLRARLMSYFRAGYPDKAARVIQAAHTIEWDYVPSEFAAYLTELRQIRRFRPVLNHHMNRSRRTVLVRVASGPAPRLSCGTRPGEKDLRCYGPFISAGRVREGLRTLNDLLGLRDCAASMPIIFAEQMDLFGSPMQAACMRHDLGLCTGPCAGFVTQTEYGRRVEAAVAFLECRAIAPIDRVIAAMQDAAASSDFELATRWRQKFEALEWLLAAAARARSAIDLLTFVYRDPGAFGDDRVYVVRRGLVRAAYPYPSTPIEEAAFRGVVRGELESPTPQIEANSSATLDEVLLIMSWFRRHPDALRRTVKLEQWT